MRRNVLCQSSARFIVSLGSLVLLAGVLLSGCANVGKDFAAVRVGEIEIGKTTREDIRQKFGPPWRVGSEDGKQTWSYGRYQYRLFGENDSQDLVIRYNKDGTVASYTFNTTRHQE